MPGKWLRAQPVWLDAFGVLKTPHDDEEIDERGTSGEDGRAKEDGTSVPPNENCQQRLATENKMYGSLPFPIADIEQDSVAGAILAGVGLDGQI